MIRKHVTFVVVLGVAELLGAQSHAERLAGKIVEISSGNILKSDKGELFLLYGIRDYKPGTDLARRAKQFTSQRVLEQDISVDIVASKFGIRYVRVTLVDGKDLGESLLAEGLAAWDSTTWPEAKNLGVLEAEGQAKVNAALEAEQEQVRAQHESLTKELRQQAAKAERERQAEEQRKRQALWDKEADAWRKATPADRKTRRAKLHAMRNELDDDTAKATYYSNRIMECDRLLSLGNTVHQDFVKSYSRLKRATGRDIAAEITVIKDETDLADMRNELDVWLREYNQLVANIERESAAYNSEWQKVAALDAALPADVKAAEDADPFYSDSDHAEGERSGTGFVVAPGGYVLTCAHVVRGASSINVRTTSNSVERAEVVCTDAENDWSILLARTLKSQPVPIASETPNVGSTVYCLGYPLAGLLTNVSAVAGSGNIAALEGFEGDKRHIQITVPINAGNSGSPILNKFGEWVGLASHKLSDIAGLRVTGNVPQGLNFAVKSSFIQGQPNAKSACAFRTQSKRKEMSLEDVARDLSSSVVRVEVK